MSNDSFCGWLPWTFCSLSCASHRGWLCDCYLTLFHVSQWLVCLSLRSHDGCPECIHASGTDSGALSRQLHNSFSFLLKRQDIQPPKWHSVWPPGRGTFGQRMNQLFFFFAFLVSLGWVLRGCLPCGTSLFGIEKAGKRVFLFRAGNKKQRGRQRMAISCRGGLRSQCRQARLLLSASLRETR